MTDDRRRTARCPPRSTCPPWSATSSRSGASTTSSPAASSGPRDGPPWVFYEGPPTANGMPGTHHVEARVFKDVFPRFQTMKGHHVPRKAGWDCHGLPVELAVEKELGLHRQARHRGVRRRRVQRACRESVERHVDEFEAMTERMGYWVDMSQAYRTMDADVRRERLVVAQADLRQGPARRRTTGSRPTARAAAPACPTTSSPRATRPSSTRRSTSGSR